ncbi:hypothetical protein CHUAL_007540 [Chamberlinius hualienensis]
MSTFGLSDYDCIGFDLDHTLCRYKLDNLFQLIYTSLNKFLVEKKGYPNSLLNGDCHYDESFIHKGLVLDIKKGNLLKVSNNGVILRASHGTTMMSRKQIANIYGLERLWPPFDTFKCNMYEGRRKLGREVRSFKDFFDMPAALVAARMVDIIDRQNAHKVNPNAYSFWPDILDGLIDMYRIEGFAQDTGGFFPALKKDAYSYIKPCTAQVKNWLKQLQRNGKIVFLVTGSNHDFVSFLGEKCLGNDWRDYFDVIVTYAGKPGFFTGQRDFLYTNGDVASSDSLKRKGIYVRGNFPALNELFTRLTGVDDPRCVYFGDNLIQDVYTPAKYSRCDTVAVVEEIEREGTLSDKKLKFPGWKWGSFFCDNEMQETKKSSSNGITRVNTLWAEVILTHSRIAIPSLDALACLPIDSKLKSFNMNSLELQSGFYPEDPKSLYQ